MKKKKGNNPIPPEQVAAEILKMVRKAANGDKKLGQALVNALSAFWFTR